MSDTRKSLLLRARDGEETAWQGIVAVYQPLIRGWLHRYDLLPQDTDDLTQDVLAILVRELKHFQHGGRTGAFRNWLRTITANRAREFWRSGRCRPKATGGDDFLGMIQQLEDPDSALSGVWNQQYQDHVLQRLLASMEKEFGPTTFRAFCRLTLEGASAQDVAKELEMSLAAVYGAKSRVLKRLREEAAGLLD